MVYKLSKRPLSQIQLHLNLYFECGKNNLEIRLRIGQIQNSSDHDPPEYSNRNAMAATCLISQRSLQIHLDHRQKGVALSHLPRYEEVNMCYCRCRRERCDQNSTSLLESSCLRGSLMASSPTDLQGDRSKIVHKSKGENMDRNSATQPFNHLHSPCIEWRILCCSIRAFIVSKNQEIE